MQFSSYVPHSAGNITIPEAVKREIEKGYIEGQDVPRLENHPWVQIISVSVPEYLNLIVDLANFTGVYPALS